MKIKVKSIEVKGNLLKIESKEGDITGVNKCHVVSVVYKRDKDIANLTVSELTQINKNRVHSLIEIGPENFDLILKFIEN